MKKHFLLIGFLALTTACNIGVPAPESDATATATLQPTLVPATTAPTFTPAPTDTPIPPRFFTDEFDTASPSWQFLQAGGLGTSQETFENGALRIDIPVADTWYVGINNTYTYTNVVVSAKVSASATGSIGLICRYEESTGWFEFNVDNGGNYSLLLGQWLAPGIAKYIPVIADVNRNIPPGNVNAEISLSCQDNIISLFINNNLIRRLDVTNYGLTEGNIGISAAAYKDAPMSAIFEWIKVSEEEQ